MAVFDPLDAATQAGERADCVFGKVEVSGSFVAIQKGMRPQPWTPDMPESIRRTEVIFSLNPLDESGLTRLVERKVLAESSEFSRVVWPSLRDLGLNHLRELHGRWVRAEMVDSGRSWTNKEGATVKGTTFKFTALYPDHAKCLAGWEGEFGTAPAADPQPASAAAPVVNEAERQTALAFLPALIANVKGDKALLAQHIANMPIIAKYFTVESPEVVALLAKAA